MHENRRRDKYAKSPLVIGLAHKKPAIVNRRKGVTFPVSAQISFSILSLLEEKLFNFQQTSFKISILRDKYDWPAMSATQSVGL